jgi:transcriptional regulator with XRE-family HTH domain
MARPPTVVKNELSVAIAELRRRLGSSQQVFAISLGLSLGAVARWELNQRPERRMLKRLIDLASDNGHQDLADIFYSEYRREFGLAYDIALATEAVAALMFATTLLDSLPEPKRAEDRIAKRTAHEVLERLKAKLSEFPTDPTDVKILP